MLRRKRCQYCAGLFVPHPAVGRRQKSCGAPACRGARRAEAQRSWVEDNPGYFRGRYEGVVKPWLERHAGYLRQHRQAQRRAAVEPEAAGRACPSSATEEPEQPLAQSRTRTLEDIQDELTALSRSVSGMLAVLGRSAIQDELTPKAGIQSQKTAIQDG